MRLISKSKKMFWVIRRTKIQVVGIIRKTTVDRFRSGQTRIKIFEVPGSKWSGAPLWNLLKKVLYCCIFNFIKHQINRWTEFWYYIVWIIKYNFLTSISLAMSEILLRIARSEFVLNIFEFFKPPMIDIESRKGNEFEWTRVFFSLFSE